MLGTVRKRPDDTLDYDVEFARWLSDGDSITSATAVATAGVSINAVQVFGTVVKVWIAGGTAGESYAIEVTATTNQGRVKDVKFNLRVTEC